MNKIPKYASVDSTESVYAFFRLDGAIKTSVLYNSLEKYLIFCILDISDPSNTSSDNTLVYQCYYESHVRMLFLAIAKKLKKGLLTKSEVKQIYYSILPESHWQNVAAEKVARKYQGLQYRLTGRGHDARVTEPNTNFSKILIGHGIDYAIVGTGIKQTSRFFPSLLVSEVYQEIKKVKEDSLCD